jgi:hypothetical protein
VIGEFFKIGASPAAGIKVEPLGMGFHLKACLLEFCPKSSPSASLIES